MISLSRLSILFLLLVDVSGVASHQITTFNDDIYGSDPDLCNGRLYIFYVPSNTGRNQFPQFETGSGTICGIIYKDLMRNEGPGGSHYTLLKIVNPNRSEVQAENENDNISESLFISALTRHKKYTLREPTTCIEQKQFCEVISYGT